MRKYLKEKCHSEHYLLKIIPIFKVNIVKGRVDPNDNLRKELLFKH